MSATQHADVVVVGAGILGLSVAHHLAAGGARVVVVDADVTAAAATTGAGAGFVGLWAAGYADFFTSTDLVLEQYGIDFYRELGDRDPSVECRGNGNLYAATTDEGWAKWVAPVVEHPLAPEGTRLLSPDEVADVTGGAVAADAVLGGALHPGGIQISAGRAAKALAVRLAEQGVEFRLSTMVTELITGDGGVEGVRTVGGDVMARAVVLACGAWMNTLLGVVDFRVPLLCVVATRVISPPSGVSATMPTVMVPDLYGLWVREHRGGLTWGNGDGYAPLFELGGSVEVGSQPRREELVARLDAAMSSKLRSLLRAHDTTIGWWLQGMPAMTPDRHFVAGGVPGVAGLFVLGGDNEAGVTHGPGLGRYLADVVGNGESDWVDGAIYEPSRFAADAYPTDEAVLAALPARR